MGIGWMMDGIMEKSVYSKPMFNLMEAGAKPLSRNLESIPGSHHRMDDGGRPGVKIPAPFSFELKNESQSINHNSHNSSPSTTITTTPPQIPNHLSPTQQQQ